MVYIIAILAVIVAVTFVIAQRNSRRQEEWRREKRRDIEAKRARIAAQRSTEEE